MHNPTNKQIVCLIHIGGELMRGNDNSVEYKGGMVDAIDVDEQTSITQLVTNACERLNIEPVGLSFMYTLKVCQWKPIPLRDTEDILRMLRCNDDVAHVYIYATTNGVDTSVWQRNNILPQSQSNSPSMQGSTVQPTDDDQQSMRAGYMSTRIASKRDPLISSTWNNAIIGSGHTFSNAEAFRNALYKLSITDLFRYKWIKNTNYKLIAHCVVDECPWKVTAVRVGQTEVVRVNTCIKMHNHSAQQTIGVPPVVRARRVASIIDDTIRESPDYKCRQLMKDFRRGFGVNLSYNQAWRCKEKAKERIHGAVEDSYKLIPWLCNRLTESNPDSQAEWTCDDDGTFKQLFIAYGCSINGFIMGCRPVLSIDSCHLSGPFRGALLSASAYDADDGLFPIAFAIVRSECYEDWYWFLTQLKTLLGDFGGKVVIISDRHNAIRQSVFQTFGTNNHAYCYRHLKENFATYVSKVNIKRKKCKDDALALLDAIAYARLDVDYSDALEKLRAFNPELAVWVENNNPEHWAMSKFGMRRWDKMTTQLAESFNAWVKEERQYSIFNFVNKHMDKLALMLYRHENAARDWIERVGPKTEERILKNIEGARGLSVLRYHDFNYKVTVGMSCLSVQLDKHTCTCKEWQMTGIPCRHACAAIEVAGHDVYSFVNECYYKETQEKIYHGRIHVIETHDIPHITIDGIVQDENEDIQVSIEPPITKRPPGRPRVKRIESQFMDKRRTHCSLCHGAGHNRKTCPCPNPSSINMPLNR